MTNRVNLVAGVTVSIAASTLLYIVLRPHLDQDVAADALPTPQDVADRCAAIKASVEDAGFSDKVKVSCDQGHAHLTSTTYPDHELMTGIVGTNEQVPVPAKDYVAPIQLGPMLSDSPQTRDAALGVAVNGVPIFDYTGGGEMSVADLNHHQARHDTLQTQQLDVCGGHAGRGDDYHYHVKPVCMIEQMKNKGDDAIIGWAFDGFPIYGDSNPDGSHIALGVLDICNGQADKTFGYRYHTSAKAPYIIQCLMGAVGDVRELPRIQPLVPAEGGPGLAPGKPPQGGVQNLIFTQDSSGQRSMDYSYKGEAYYIRYTPTDKPNCYAFETRTVTNGGEVKTGEYCR
ncbi:YHYH protein [Acaryochloris sp. IP29b_bin.148]|uniref:YHYH protein n=1 Tax=Acaryochloris sp. IP29b_bin.148 TaxID=2969218 RepID=UPI00262F5106|nr:YHYH protein [Acaryochloris sp. IP29b_bin.148]